MFLIEGFFFFSPSLQTPAGPRVAGFWFLYLEESSSSDSGPGNPARICWFRPGNPVCDLLAGSDGRDHDLLTTALPP